MLMSPIEPFAIARLGSGRGTAPFQPLEMRRASAMT